MTRGEPPPRVGACVVREAIAAGSHGAVFRAEHADTGAAAAIKVMHAELASSAEAVARFTLEVALLQRAQHPSVLAVRDAGRLADGRLYLVSELLVGESLEARLGRGAPGAAEGLAILGPVCAALATAHARGVVTATSRRRTCSSRRRRGRGGSCCSTSGSPSRRTAGRR